MTSTNQDIAKSLLSMPSEDFHKFVRQALRSKNLHDVVHTLNEQCLSKADPVAAPARAALARIGFID